MDFTSFLIGRASKKSKVASLESYNFGFKIGAISEKNVTSADRSQFPGMFMGESDAYGMRAYAATRRAASTELWHKRIDEIAYEIFRGIKVDVTRSQIALYLKGKNPY